MNTCIQSQTVSVSEEGDAKKIFSSLTVMEFITSPPLPAAHDEKIGRVMTEANTEYRALNFIL